MSTTPQATLALASWPYLGPEQLLPSRSQHVCHLLLSCQWHQALICHGDHLTQRCPCWIEPLHVGSGWCPEAA
jgi:hypothetical protein